MYQIKATDGYELVVIGKNARVVDSNHQVKFEGKYNACVQWLEDRGVTEVNGTKFPRS